MISVNPITIYSVIGFIIMAVLLFTSALVSGSEVAFFALSPSQINILKKKNQRNSNLVLKLIDKPQQLLATILIANNFVNIGIVVISTYITNTIFDFSNVPLLGFIFQVIIVTLLLLLFGEIVPKIYANNFNLQFALVMSTPIFVIGKVVSPISAILLKLSFFVNKPFSKGEVSMDDISQALEITSESMTSEKEILESIVKMKDTDVEEIMKSRVDVVAVDIQKSFSEIKDKIISSGYSRIPVYSGTFDNVKGILYVKDLLPHIQKNVFRWQTLIRPPYYVPYTKKIDDLLEDFQKSKVHLAIVIDEYGGTSGIITLDDILEEIIGEFNDEFDTEDYDYTKVSDNTYLFEGRFLLNDFYKVVDVDSNIFDVVKGDADTLAGLILEIKGDFPQLFEEISYKNFIFKIEAEDNRRIHKIKVTVNKD